MVIVKVLLREKQEGQRERRRNDNTSRGQRDAIAGSESGSGPQAKEWQAAATSWKRQETDSFLKLPEGLQPT